MWLFWILGPLSRVCYWGFSNRVFVIWLRREGVGKGVGEGLGRAWLSVLQSPADKKKNIHVPRPSTPSCKCLRFGFLCFEEKKGPSHKEIEGVEAILEGGWVGRGNFGWNCSFLRLKEWTGNSEKFWTRIFLNPPWSDGRLPLGHGCGPYLSRISRAWGFGPGRPPEGPRYVCGMQISGNFFRSGS